MGLEDRAAAQLALGQHATVAGELESLTRTVPASRATLGPAGRGPGSRRASGRGSRRACGAAATAGRGARAGARTQHCASCRRPCFARIRSSPGRHRRARPSRTVRIEPAAPSRSARRATGPAARSTPTWTPSARRRGRWWDVTRSWPCSRTCSRLPRRGTPSFASLLGQPGIGKSRLAFELAHVAAEPRCPRGTRSLLAGRRRAAALAVDRCVLDARPRASDRGRCRGRGRPLPLVGRDRRGRTRGGAPPAAARRPRRPALGRRLLAARVAPAAGVGGPGLAHGRRDLADRSGADRSTGRRRGVTGPAARSTDRAGGSVVGPGRHRHRGGRRRRATGAPPLRRPGDRTSRADGRKPVLPRGVRPARRRARRPGLAARRDPSAGGRSRRPGPPRPATPRGRPAAARHSVGDRAAVRPDDAGARAVDG